MLTTDPLLVLRLRKSRSYTSSHPKRLHGMQWDYFTFFFTLKTGVWKLRRMRTGFEKGSCYTWIVKTFGNE
jgi:hypothetical protein